MAPFQRTWISWFRSLGQLLAIAEQSPLGPLTCLPHQSHTSFLLSRHGIWAQMPGLSFINLRLTKWISYLPSTLLSSLLSTLLSSFSSFLPFFFFNNTHAHRYETAAAAKSLQSCPTLCDPMDGSPSGSPVPGILQARILEWVAISFSNAWKVKSESEVA